MPWGQRNPKETKPLSLDYERIKLFSKPNQEAKRLNAYNIYATDP